MPIVKIEMLKGKTKEYKKAIFDSIHEAIVDVLKTPELDRKQKIYEFEPENFEVGQDMSQDALMIEITAFSGRSYEAKTSLYKMIVGNLKKNPGIEPMDVLIVIKEVPSGNWAIKGGQCAREVDLGYKVGV